jgi:membrane-associated HD superfamily phosphohydrolase
MKKLILIIVALGAFTICLAQKVEIREATKAMNKGTFNSYTVELTEITMKEAEESWKKWMSGFKTKTKFQKKNNLWFSNDASIKKMSENTVDVYARFENGKKTERPVTVTVWFDLGGAYLSSRTHPAQASCVNDLLNKYAMSTYKRHTEAIVKAEEKVLKTLEADMDKLKNEQESFLKEIEKAKDLIAKMEKNLKDNKKGQLRKGAEISAQEKVVSEAKKEAKKYN